jgi:hypothetical protein
VPGTPYETVIGITEVVPNVLIGRRQLPIPAGVVHDGKSIATYVVEKGKPLASPAK